MLEAIQAASPGTEVIMLTGHGSIDTAIESVRVGAFDYVAKPCPLDELEMRIQRALERQSLRRRATLLERGLTPPDVGELVRRRQPRVPPARCSSSSASRPSDSTVLITGETGSGKEMVAKLIHARSSRRGRPFVVVECAALQESLLQSELFGHERGAFTGADRAKPGLFEVADGGTIFLDEIGEVSQATQVKLLRVLDTSTFRHVGGTAEIRVDVRVLAATNRDLPALVRQGLFREDLFYRLSTIAVECPPLRAAAGRRRPAGQSLRGRAQRPLRCRTSTGRARPRGARAPRLARQRPRAAARHRGGDGRLRRGGDPARHLPPRLGARSAFRAGEPPAAQASLPTLEEVEREHVARALRAADGHRGNAAKMLGISERNLYRKLREYGLLS